MAVHFYSFIGQKNLFISQTASLYLPSNYFAKGVIIWITLTSAYSNQPNTESGGKNPANIRRGTDVAFIKCVFYSEVCIFSRSDIAFLLKNWAKT